MAGIGIKLNKFFEKSSVTSYIVGSGYSVISTIAPMLVVIGVILIMQAILGYSDASYSNKQLFQSTVLYVFIFSLLGSSLLNAVLSKYVSDVIFKEEYDNIMAAFYLGLALNLILDCIMFIPFTIHEHFVGKVGIGYILTSIACFLSLSLVFYTMLYLSLCKDYGKVSLFYIIGMTISVLFSLLLVKVFHVEVTYAMLLSLTIGFFIIACLGYALLRQYFTKNSGKYKEVFLYICKFWRLILANFFYTLGLYIHNFVFWNTSLRNVVVHSFVYAESYDFATCIAMFTNISASVIFVALVEMRFNARYKQYSEAIIGGRLLDITKTKSRMFRMLADQIMSMVRIQFIISTVVFLICMLVLQKLGYSGVVIQLYPCLAAGYFIMYIMYSTFLFLYYFNDITGSLITSFLFVLFTLIFSIISSKLDIIWYGAGLVIGSFIAWTYGYFRLKWLEKNIEYHIFCNGTILDQVVGDKPTSKVYQK